MCEGVGGDRHPRHSARMPSTGLRGPGPGTVSKGKASPLAVSRQPWGSATHPTGGQKKTLLA